jgi:hypothetical protein
MKQKRFTEEQIVRALHELEAGSTTITEKAAEQGLALAQYKLGVMYAKGHGVPKDYGKAYMFINLAAAKTPSFTKGRDILETLMSPSQIEEGQRLTRKWLQTHPNQ